MKKLFFVSLALVTALATSPAAKADEYKLNFTLGGTCSQGGTGCNSQNATTDPAGASATAANGTPISITGSGYFTVTSSNPGYDILGGSFTIDGQTATLITTSTPGAAQSTTNLDWYYPVTNLVTQSGYYGTYQTVTDPTGQNGVYFDNLLLPGYSQPLDDLGISFMVPGLGTNPNPGDPYPGAVFNIYSDGGTLYWNEVVDGAWAIDPLTGAGGDPLNISVDYSTIPEPSSLLLLGTGLLLLAVVIFRKVKSGVTQSL
jgi:hypothetical protein